MSTLRKKFGRRVKYLRTQRGMTQEQLAEAIGVSVDLISLIERGKSATSFDRLEKIATAFGVTLKELFNFEDNEMDKSDRS